MPAAIEAKGLTKRYDSVLAVDELSLTVGEGEVFGFLGPNGAGKSTTTKMLTTLVQPSSGTARVGGFDVTDNPLEVRRIIGYLPERVPVYRNMTAREYLITFARLHGLEGQARQDRVEGLLELVNLTNVDGRAVGGFSKGMTQRLGLARALLNKPRVLFLDEPASGLDPTGRKEIRVLMRKLADAGTTVFLCTHDLAEAQAVCDQIGFIRQGKLVNVHRVNDIRLGAHRILHVKTEEITEALLRNVEAIAGVREAKRDGVHIEIAFTEPATRDEIARAIQKAGGIVLDVQEKAPSIEKLYEEYVETPREGAGDAVSADHASAAQAPAEVRR